MFRHCTVGSLIKELGQDNDTVRKLNRRFISFSGLSPKVVIDSCYVAEISSVISVLESDTIKNNLQGHNNGYHTPEVVIRDSQIFDTDSIFEYERISSDGQSGLTFDFSRNLVQFQSKSYENDHPEEFRGCVSNVVEGNILSYSRRRCLGINITEAKEVNIRGNCLASRTLNILMINLGKVEKVISYYLVHWTIINLSNILRSTLRPMWFQTMPTGISSKTMLWCPA